MADNQYLLNQLQQLLSWKKSKKFYAEKLGIGEEEVESLLREIKESKEAIRTEAETSDYIGLLEDAVVKYEEDLARGVGEVIFNSAEEIRSLDELIAKCKIDTEKWEITKYVQNYWGNSKTPHWQVKAWMAKKSTEQLFQDSFVEFLKEYQPTSKEIPTPRQNTDKSLGCLIINKQDFIPWNLVHLGQKNVHIYKNNDDEFNTEYTVMYDNWQRGKIKKEYITIKDMDFHVMNKLNFMELIV